MFNFSYWKKGPTPGTDLRLCTGRTLWCFEATFYVTKIKGSQAVSTPCVESGEGQKKVHSPSWVVFWNVNFGDLLFAVLCWVSTKRVEVQKQERCKAILWNRPLRSRNYRKTPRSPKTPCLEVYFVSISESYKIHHDRGTWNQSLVGRLPDGSKTIPLSKVLKLGLEQLHWYCKTYSINWWLSLAQLKVQKGVLLDGLFTINKAGSPKPGRKALSPCARMRGSDRERQQSL